MQPVRLRPALRLALLLLAPTLPGCGEGDEAAAPGVDFAPTDAPAAAVGESKADDPRVDVWTRVPYAAIASAHPYENNTRRTWPIEIPGARKLRVHFDRFETQAQSDRVEMRGVDGHVVARYSGHHAPFTSAAIDGSYADLTLRTNASTTGWGFEVDAVEVYGVGCLADSDCGAGYLCPMTRRCVQEPCFQTCEPDPAATPPVPPTAPPTAPPAPATDAPSAPPAPATDAPVEPAHWDTDGSVAHGQEARFAVDVPADATHIQIAMTGTGDADLYTRFGTPPTANQYTCRPYLDTSDETCESATNPGGRLYLLVRGYAANNDYAVSVTWQRPGDAPAPPPAPPTAAPAPAAEELDVSGTLAAGVEARYHVDAAAGERVTVELTGTGDSDLYVRKGNSVDTTHWDCRPYLDTSNEACTLTAATAGPLSILVAGYSAQSNYPLRTHR